mmetsp:Transcript_5895/g.23320  ORF Transcript_5895/g.23320 Transcript_5895/m.23320 type:complete len:234 (-) Transcript_5895:2779-3480(-)
MHSAAREFALVRQRDAGEQRHRGPVWSDVLPEGRAVGLEEWLRPWPQAPFFQWLRQRQQGTRACGRAEALHGAAHAVAGDAGQETADVAREGRRRCCRDPECRRTTEVRRVTKGGAARVWCHQAAGTERDPAEPIHGSLAAAALAAVLQRRESGAEGPEGATAAHGRPQAHKPAAAAIEGQKASHRARRRHAFWRRKWVRRRRAREDGRSGRLAGAECRRQTCARSERVTGVQ